MKKNIGQLPQHIADWLHKRGINDKIIDAFSVSFGPTEHLPAGGIHIPVNDITGEQIFKKYRRDPLDDSKPKYLYDRGGKITLYGADYLIRESPHFAIVEPSGKPPVVITEGELDTLVLWSQNIPAVSSTGGAMSFQEEWTELLDRYDVYICFDNDDAGAKGMVKALGFLPTAKIIFVPEQIGVTDISDFVGKGGDFHHLMKTAVSFPDMSAVEADKQKRAAQWLPVRFHDAYIDKHQPHSYTAETGKYAGDDEVLKAKSYPCTALIEFNREKNAVCLWHNDSTPSLHYYPKNNNCYCHSCGKYADVIDIFMTQHTNLKFEDAVSELCAKL